MHCHANWVEKLNGAFTEPPGFTRDVAWETLTQAMMLGCEMSPIDLGTMRMAVEPSGGGNLEEVHLWAPAGVL